MNELTINCSLKSPQAKESRIVINVDNNLEQKLIYKYMIGCNGIWDTLRDFTSDEKVEWIPEEDGKYILMVQAKKVGGNKSFDYISKMDYIIGRAEEKLISRIYIDKDKLELGDKLNITVETTKFPVIFRYWIRIEDEWEMIKDYSADNILSWVAKSEGAGEILAECKNIDSKNDFDDFKSVKFQVLPLKDIVITDFKCLTWDLVKDSELIFKVDSEHDNDRTILYKFFKINSNGKTECVQDYSTKRIVSYMEKESGEYKLLCLAKDIYSMNKFDDRAVLNFKVKKYDKIYIKNFTTDINYPQLCGTKVTLKAETIGGRELLYRYVIEGNCSEDSGYITCNNYVWESRQPGKYKLILMVKDRSFQGNYEAIEYLNYIVDEKSREPVKIEGVILNRNNPILKNEDISMKVNASGGMDLKYGFLIRKDGTELEKIKYSSNNFMEFTPSQKGKYELEARVKDRYSDREYDCHSIISIDVLDYIPAVIDYILYPAKEHFLVGDEIVISSVAQNTRSIVIKYVLSINGHKVEETDFVTQKIYAFVPKYSGTYKVEIFARNIKSCGEFDCKREVCVEVNEALPVTNTRITCDNLKFVCNMPVTFTAHNQGGKDVLYEFYIMENGDWNLVQGYSKKNYYTFIPFNKGEYKVLVLCKSQHNKVSYEDYNMLLFRTE
ncbi:triple tyrosine motif-containing protein [Clostridium sp. JNZ X4-2]